MLITFVTCLHLATTCGCHMLHFVEFVTSKICFGELNPGKNHVVWDRHKVSRCGTTSVAAWTGSRLPDFLFSAEHRVFHWQLHRQFRLKVWCRAKCRTLHNFPEQDPGDVTRAILCSPEYLSASLFSPFACLSTVWPWKHVLFHSFCWLVGHCVPCLFVKAPWA